MNKGRVLITGGAGFIGSHTADDLVRRGYKITILDNLEPPVHNCKWPPYINSRKFTLIRGDVRRKNDWLKALSGCQAVLHLAAYQDQRPEFSKFCEVNTVGTALLYQIVAERK